MRTAEEIFADGKSKGELKLFKIAEPELYANILNVINEARKEAAIDFLKWNAEKVGAFIIYIQDVQKIVRSNEIEENMVKFEGSTIEERYELFLESIKELT